jgi:hypothetical protein
LIKRESDKFLIIQIPLNYLEIYFNG